jgi:hypothetical protein
MKRRFRRGDKVEVISGCVRPGQHGIIDCLPHPTMRRYFDWCVEFPDGYNGGFREAELNFSTAHQPLSTGALRF